MAVLIQSPSGQIHWPSVRVVLIKSFDMPRTKSNMLISFVVSLSNHERIRKNQRVSGGNAVEGVSPYKAPLWLESNRQDLHRPELCRQFRHLPVERRKTPGPSAAGEM